MSTFVLLIHSIEKIESLNFNILSTTPLNVTNEFTQLQQKLPLLRKFFLSYGEQSYVLRPFVVQLEKIFGNLDDTLDNCLTAFSPHRTRVTVSSVSLLSNYHLRGELYSLVRKTLTMLEEVFQQLTRTATLRILERERETSSDVEGEFLGREREKETILQRLVDNSHKEYLEVIPIIGIGGIGKTVLAKVIYNDEWVIRYFELRSWVHVFRTSSLRSIAEEILEPLQQLGTSQDIMQLVRDTIQGRRWLLVLDGVEDEDLAMRLHTELMTACRYDSKLLMTTRSSFIPMSLTRQTPVLLEILSLRDAFSLFESIAFKQGQKPRDPRKIQIGMVIVGKCGGVPLTIRVIGSLLRNKDSLQDWLSFDSTQIIYQSVIKWRLDHLPANLQLCFAYCGLLPKKHDIDLHTLIALWMAQGFIAEDIGNDYFYDLLELNLFHDVQKDEWGSARSCRMQDFMHDLAIYASSNRIILMDPHGETVHERVYHITLDFNLDSSWKIPKSLLKAHGLRTILLSPQSRLPHEVKLSTSTCHAIFSSFKRLRVLDLHDLGMKMIPDSLGKLKNLRYLDLSKNSFATLPRSTTSLFNLQTLKLSNCHKLKELPGDFQNLVNLRHLEMDGCFAMAHMPLALGSLTSLQTLSRFVVRKINNSASNTVGLEQLTSLNNLRGNLEILHLERAKCNPSSAHNPILDQKQQLQCLTLRWNRDFDDDEEEEEEPDAEGDNRLLELLKPHPNLKALYIMGFKGEFPSEYFSVLSLVRLSLFNCPIIQSLSPLHQLPSLQILELERLEAMKFVEDSSDIAPTSTFYPSLKEVTIWDCLRLTSWWKSGADLPYKPAAFPSRDIQKLEIGYCPKLSTIPFYPEKLILICSSMDQLEQIMKKTAEGSSSSRGIVHSWLKSLIIGRIEDLKSLPEVGLRSFTSLQCLHIQDCHKLTSLSQGIQHMSSLESLNIENCMELNLDKEKHDDGQWDGLIRLRTLVIRGIPKLEALPEGLANTKSLQDLQLYSCPSLMSLPKWISNLTSLDKLTIEDCPKLLPRCQHETGEDWPQIAHIPHKSLK